MWAVRPPVFGWDCSSGEGRYCVYERCLERWKEAGWTKGGKLRTMRQVQRGRGRTISVHGENGSSFFRVEGVVGGGVVDGEEVNEEEVQVSVAQWRERTIRVYNAALSGI